MRAHLPPSSSVTRLIVPAALRTISTPTSVDPVKPTLATSGCSTSASPTTSPGPGTTFSTPGGSPASSASSAYLSAERGERLAGLRTTELPAAIAGAVFQLPMLSGKFHGVISAATPIGSRNVSRTPSRSTGIV